MPCDCPLAGRCRDFGWDARTQPRRFGICKGTIGTPELQAGYRKAWSKPRKIKPTTKAAVRRHPAAGPGTELKKLLKRMFFEADKKCLCHKRAAAMDSLGPDWCEQNIETVVGWLREAAAERSVAGLLFTETGARILIRRAIRNARRVAAAKPTSAA